MKKNLPRTITKGSDSIGYVYSATGEKLALKKNGNIVSYYAGNTVYKADGTTDYIMTDEGSLRRPKARSASYA